MSLSSSEFAGLPDVERLGQLPARDGQQRSLHNAVVTGATQVFAPLPGISRDGIVAVTGMFRGLTREDVVRFSFLLSALVILAAGC